MKKKSVSQSVSFNLRILMGLFLGLAGVHMTFGGGLTANIAAGAITDSCTWSSGPDMPSVGVRLVGVYFPANGKFYEMGGRSSDSVGSDFTHPFEYDPGTNTWTTKSATYPDAQVNNMACGVLTESGTPYIYCVGGSQATFTTATARVFRYNPVTDTITILTAADNWPGDAAGAILPGGFAVANNELFILGGFDIVISSTNQIWQFDPTAAVGSKWTQKVNTPEGIMYAPTCSIGGIIYVGGASDFDSSSGAVIDTTNSFSFNPGANTIGTIAPIPRATGETRALNFNGQMLVMGGGRVAPNPSNEVDVYDPGSNTWSTSVLPFTTGRRNFPTDTDGTSHIWLAGGYDINIVPLSSMEIFTCTTVENIVLSASVRRQQGGNRVVALQWTPADGGSINIMRNGVVLGSTTDDGSFQDNLKKKTGDFTYQVCETDTGTCSNVVNVRINPPAATTRPPGGASALAL